MYFVLRTAVLTAACVAEPGASLLMQDHTRCMAEPGWHCKAAITCSQEMNMLYGVLKGGGPKGKDTSGTVGNLGEPWGTLGSIGES